MDTDENMEPPMDADLTPMHADEKRGARGD